MGPYQIFDRFCSLVFLLRLCFFQEVEKQGERCIDRQHTNVYLSFVCTLFYLDADHSIYSVYSESSLYAYEPDTFRSYFNGQRGLRKTGYIKCYDDYAIWVFVSIDPKQEYQT